MVAEPADAEVVEPAPTWGVRFVKDLAPLYGVTTKTVGTYYRKGAPVRNPERMQAWWEEHMKQRTPDWILRAAEKVAAEAEAAEAPAVAGYRFSVIDEVELTWEQVVRRQRGLVNAYGKELDDATREGRPIETINRRYQQALTTLRHLEKDSARIQIDSGRAWDKGAVAAVLVEVGTAINTALDNIPHLLKSKLGLDTEGLRRVREEVNRVRQPLTQLKDYMDGDRGEAA